MADQLQEILDVPREFLKDGIQFINRAQKRTSSPIPKPPGTALANTSGSTADRPEFIKISQAVGVGFLVMGAVGYFVKLSMPLHPARTSQKHPRRRRILTLRPQSTSR